MTLRRAAITFHWNERANEKLKPEGNESVEHALYIYYMG